MMATLSSFTRTFMELKVWRRNELHSLPPSFTRTFMELKVNGGLQFAFSNPFYSHLYGIERKLMEGLVKVENSFTRTFMELKVINYCASGWH